MLPSTSRVITEAANNTKNSNSLLPTQRKRGLFLHSLVFVVTTRGRTAGHLSPHTPLHSDTPCITRDQKKIEPGECFHLQP